MTCRFWRPSRMPRPSPSRTRGSMRRSRAGGGSWKPSASSPPRSRGSWTFRESFSSLRVMQGSCSAAARATVWLWDEEEQVLDPRGLAERAGVDARPASPTRRGLGRQRGGAEAKGLIVNEYRPLAQGGSRYPGARHDHRSPRPSPCCTMTRLLGVLVVDNEGTGRTFTQEDGDLLALFASHAAIAIQNARFFEQVQPGRSAWRTFRAGSSRCRRPSGGTSPASCTTRSGSLSPGSSSCLT